MVYEYKNGKWVKATPIPYRQNLLQRIVAWPLKGADDE